MTLPPDDLRALLRASLAAAEKRWRWEWLAKAMGRLGMGLAAVFAGWALLALLAPGTASHWREGVLVAAGGLAVLVAESRLREAEPHRIRRRMDARLGLADAVLTSAELLDAPDNPWTHWQLEHTAANLRGVDWCRTWPVRLPRRTLAWYAVAALLVGFLASRSAAWHASHLPPPPTTREKADARALREMFDDWEAAEQEQPDPELKALLEELRPVREKLAGKEAALSAREALALLSRVEDRLADRQAKLEAQSLQPLAADFAAALDGMNGLGTLAAAVRRGDFQSAEAQAAEAARRMQADGAPPPGKENGTKSAQSFEKLGQQFARKGDQNGQRGAEEMKEGLQKGQSGQAGRGLDHLKESLAAQNARDGQKRDLASQMRQVKAGKKGLGNQQGAGGISLLPRLASARKQGPGKGADRSTDPNRRGGATDLASNRAPVDLGGTADARGESEHETESTSEVPKERAGGAAAANFRSYEALSQQAVADENLPLAHRQAIKRYFEAIRPPEGR